MQGRTRGACKSTLFLSPHTGPSLSRPSLPLVASAVVILAAALVLIGPVSSAIADSKGPSGPSWSFSIPGSRGYDISVSAASGHLDVFVHGHASDTEYLFRGHDRGGDLEGDIGTLGTVAMRFVPSERPRSSEEPNGCHGHRPTVQRGHFVGRFRFRGEAGYTSASVQRAVGYYEHGFRGLCQGGGEEPLRPNLTARASSRSRSTSVAVYFREYEVSTEVEVVEHVGALRISRFVGLAAPVSAAAVEPDGSIVISPPSPFSGSVRYSPESSNAPWIGDLSADFPGIGSLALAGPRFKVSMPRASAFP